MVFAQIDNQLFKGQGYLEQRESNLKVIKFISTETLSDYVESLNNFVIHLTTNHKSPSRTRTALSPEFQSIFVQILQNFRPGPGETAIRN